MCLGNQNFHRCLVREASGFRRFQIENFDDLTHAKELIFRGLGCESRFYETDRIVSIFKTKSYKSLESLCSLLSCFLCLLVLLILLQIYCYGDHIFVSSIYPVIHVDQIRVRKPWLFCK